MDGLTPVFDNGKNEFEEELFRADGLLFRFDDLLSTAPLFESFKWFKLDADGLAKPAPCMIMFLSSNKFVDISIEE
jgi:hypothetical protein